MNVNWIKIYSSASLQKTELIKAILENHKIEAVIVNKKDSSYLFPGEIELYVPRHNALQALQIIKKGEH